jgi:hypothetical protein
MAHGSPLGTRASAGLDPRDPGAMRNHAGGCDRAWRFGNRDGSVQRPEQGQFSCIEDCVTLSWGWNGFRRDLQPCT